MSGGLFLWTVMVLSHSKSVFNPEAELDQTLAATSNYWQTGPEQKLNAVFASVIASLEANVTDQAFLNAYTAVTGALVTLRAPLPPKAVARLVELDGFSLRDVLEIGRRIQPLLQGFNKNDPDSPCQILHLSVQIYLTQQAPLLFRLNLSQHQSALSTALLQVVKTELVKETHSFLGFSCNENSPEPSSIDKQISPQLQYACMFLADHLINTNFVGSKSPPGPLVLEVLVISIMSGKFWLQNQRTGICPKTGH